MASPPRAVERYLRKLTITGGHRPVLQVVKSQRSRTRKATRARVAAQRRGRWSKDAGRKRPSHARLLRPPDRDVQFVRRSMIYADFDITGSRGRHADAWHRAGRLSSTPPSRALLPPPPTVEEVEATFATARRRGNADVQLAARRPRGRLSRRTPPLLRKAARSRRRRGLGPADRHVLNYEVASSRRRRTTCQGGAPARARVLRATRLRARAVWARA